MSLELVFFGDANSVIPTRSDIEYLYIGKCFSGISYCRVTSKGNIQQSRFYNNKILSFLQK